MRICKPCGGNTFLIRCVKLSVSDVFHYCSREKVYILQNNSERASEICFSYLIDIDAVISYLSVCNIIETVYKIRYSRFACTRCADKGYLLSLFSKDGYIMQDSLFFRISEIDLIHNDIAVKLCISRCSVAVGMLPCPHLRSFLCFNYIVILIVFCIHKCNIAIVMLAFLIHKLENTFCACKSHYYSIYLHGYLAERT